MARPSVALRGPQARGGGRPPGDRYAIAAGSSLRIGVAVLIPGTMEASRPTAGVRVAVS